MVDPFCGSGTFPIEAAMMAANMAPGMNRSFTAESWTEVVGRRNWYDAVDEAGEMVRYSMWIQTFRDMISDEKMVAVSRENARLAGVEKLIHFQRRPLSELRHPKKYGFLITNPPYGERLEEKEALPACTGRWGTVCRPGFLVHVSDYGV